jgi:DNA-binding LytR/AlgR family response regulator
MIANDALFIKTQERLERINLSNILWVEVAFDRYCQIQTANRAYTLRTPLKNLETKLATYGFVRIHRAYIANLQKIDSLDDKKMIINIGKHELPLGTVYKQMIMEKLTIL